MSIHQSTVAADNRKGDHCQKNREGRSKQDKPSGAAV